ncbi:AtpZ/AtpI family protein [Winogradskyella sp. PE311]|uniref:AtpZ/AtpI family protein n=1 Tax=Winogradskyella sp. PE311 TaxID=3366943 RepID=UPI003980C280
MSQLYRNQRNNKQTKKQSAKLNNYALFSGIAIQMIAIIGVGTFIGYKLDEYYPNQYNLYTLVLSLGSVIMSIVYVIRRIIVNSKEDN